PAAAACTCRRARAADRVARTRLDRLVLGAPRAERRGIRLPWRRGRTRAGTREPTVARIAAGVCAGFGRAREGRALAPTRHHPRRRDGDRRHACRTGLGRSRTGLPGRARADAGTAPRRHGSCRGPERSVTRLALEPLSTAPIALQAG